MPDREQVLPARWRADARARLTRGARVRLTRGLDGDRLGSTRPGARGLGLAGRARRREPRPVSGSRAGPGFSTDICYRRSLRRECRKSLKRVTRRSSPNTVYMMPTAPASAPTPARERIASPPASIALCVSASQANTRPPREQRGTWGTRRRRSSR